MTTPDAVRVVRLAETGSTSKDALRLALQGEALPLWVVAGRQTEGRGRAGRSWVSLPGNLQASVAIVCQAPLARAGQLALVAGVALFDAVRETSPLAETLSLRLKWPNDLLIGGAKVGGILVESTMARGEPGFLAVIGIGLNVAQAPDVVDRRVTSLAACGVTASAEDVFQALARRMTEWLEVWGDGRSFEPAVRSAWMARGGPLGEQLAVSAAGGTVMGRYAGVDFQGYLVIETPNGAYHTVTHGDVALSSAPENTGLNDGE